MTPQQALVLGIVQGLTEFLPISSSGHLVLVNYYLGWGDSLPLYVDIATNSGTLLAVVLFLRKDVGRTLAGFVAGLRSLEGRREEGWALAVRVLVASAPTVAIGLSLRGVFERLNAPVPVSFALIATGLLLWFTPRSGPKTEARKLSLGDALVAGVAQGLAVIPGVSRSGTTIATLLARGASADLAPRISFLMYLVVSFGVAGFGLFEVTDEVEAAPLVLMAAGSFTTGYLALFWLFALLRRGQFRWFAPYLWAVALFTLAWATLH